MRATSVSARVMNFPHFLRIEHEQPGGSRHFVVHTHEPRITVEFAPDGAAPGESGRSVIKRVCVPNSWAGDYGQSAKLITTAQEFFEQSFAASVPAAEVRRFAR